MSRDRKNHMQQLSDFIFSFVLGNLYMALRMQSTITGFMLQNSGILPKTVTLGI